MFASRPFESRSSAFTLVELLVCITIIAMLMTLLFPVYVAARDRGRQAVCLSNMRQLPVALATYAQDHDSIAPKNNGGCAWASTLLPYVDGAWGVFQCPSHIGSQRWGGEHPLGYALNDRLVTYHPQRYTPLTIRADLIDSGTLPYPSSTIAFSEVADLHYQKDNMSASPCYADWSQSADRDLFEPGMSFVGGRAGALRHGGGSHYAFLDGHVRWLRPEEVRPSDVKTGGRFPGFSLE